MSDSLDFEKAMARLEEIVSQLESGEGSLENAMKLFEEGAKLSARCYEALQNAEQKITELSQVQEASGNGDE